MGVVEGIGKGMDCSKSIMEVYSSLREDEHDPINGSLSVLFNILKSFGKNVSGRIERKAGWEEDCAWLYLKSLSVHNYNDDS